jgi:NADH:ubiquinone reductase (non-electrogenic)
LLAGVGLAGTLVYSVYDQRNPIEQSLPDPKKKTLVILGRFASFGFVVPLIAH